VTTPLERFAFVDSVHAAEVLHVTQDTILDWVASGKLRPFGGKPSNPFLRSADIAALVQEIGIQADEPPRRTKSASAKVQARLTADSRWSDVEEDDIRDWARRADAARRQAARTAAQIARRRLELVISVLEEMG
jgi:hypothetical protein